MLNGRGAAYNIELMTLLSEILQSLSAEAGISVQYTVVGGKGGYFQNVRKILEFSPEKIVFRGKKEKISVEGQGLSVGKYCDGDALVLGNIQKVELSE